MDEDICVTFTDIGVPPTELADPINSHPPRAPAPKRIYLGARGQANPTYGEGNVVIPCMHLFLCFSSCSHTQ